MRPMGVVVCHDPPSAHHLGSGRLSSHGGSLSGHVAPQQCVDWCCIPVLRTRLEIGPPGCKTGYPRVSATDPGACDCIGRVSTARYLRKSPQTPRPSDPPHDGRGDHRGACRRGRHVERHDACTDHPCMPTGPTAISATFRPYRPHQRRASVPASRANAGPADPDVGPLHPAPRQGVVMRWGGYASRLSSMRRYHSTSDRSALSTYTRCPSCSGRM